LNAARSSSISKEKLPLQIAALVKSPIISDNKPIRNNKNRTVGANVSETEVSASVLAAARKRDKKNMFEI